MKSVFHILNPSPAGYNWVKATTDGNASHNPWGWVSKEHPEHIETLVDWALKEGVDRIVVWGGDGSFHRVVRRVWKQKALDRVELALIPAGTCNDLSRRMNLSKYFWRRWEADQPEVSRLVDFSLYEINWDAVSEIFINNAGFGRPRESFEKKEGSWGVLKSFQPIHVSARWPGGELQGNYYMALACSGPYFSGGLHFEKDQSPENDKFRLYLVPATSKLRLGLRLLRGKMGMPLFDAKVSRIEAGQVTLETDRPVWPQTDGEAPPEAGTRRIEIRLLPEKARVWCPNE